MWKQEPGIYYSLSACHFSTHFWGPLCRLWKACLHIHTSSVNKKNHQYCVLPKQTLVIFFNVLLKRMPTHLMRNKTILSIFSKSTRMCLYTKSIACICKLYMHTLLCIVWVSYMNAASHANCICIFHLILRTFHICVYIYMYTDKNEFSKK